MSQCLTVCLRSFVESANAHPRVAKLLQGWEPTMLIEALDDGQQFMMRARNARLEEIDSGGVTGHSILLRGDSTVLRDVFSGAVNPAQAYLEGTLEVFGSERDHIKLDAISLVLWGM